MSRKKKMEKRMEKALPDMPNLTEQRHRHVDTATLNYTREMKIFERSIVGSQINDTTGRLIMLKKKAVMLEEDIKTLSALISKR